MVKPWGGGVSPLGMLPQAFENLVEVSGKERGKGTWTPIPPLLKPSHTTNHPFEHPNHRPWSSGASRLAYGTWTRSWPATTSAACLTVLAVSKRRWSS